MAHPIIFWGGFHLLIALLLAIDFKFFIQKRQVMKLKEALILSAFWILIALLFNLFVYFSLGMKSALQFFTGYLIEKSLSVDNLLLFVVIFLRTGTPAADQRKILFWGILGALSFRIFLILSGIALIDKFDWMFYVFGAFLVLSGVKFLKQNPVRNSLFRMLSRVLSVEEGRAEGCFFVRRQGKWKATSLFLTLLMVECTDIIMALDSIPAIFSITVDPFIVYTSNVFAILGLRALYFVISTSLSKLKYLKVALTAILIFAGAKMLLKPCFEVSLPVSLAVIVIILCMAILASLRKSWRN
jgi:tellurite resistance protein TerC